ncbi:MAG: prepilin-type N-terminal cleavage/methylation domain-containing protein [Deferribacterales bacterium]
MPTSEVLRSRNSGFTLIELLVVIIIIGIGISALMPRLAKNGIAGQSREDAFSSMITEQLKNAHELNRQVCLRGEKGSSAIYTEEKKKLTPSSDPIVSADINGTPSAGGQYVICFYPDDVFDQFDLTDTSGRIISADPVTKTVVIR